MIFNTIRKRSKLYSILFSLLFLIPTGSRVNACGFVPGHEEMRYMLFNPDILQDKAWWSFFYTSEYNYLDGRVSSDEDEVILAGEWMQQMKVSVDTAVVVDCLFGSLTDSAMQHNAFYQEIQRRPAFKKYFDIAIRSEAHSYYGYIWDEQRIDEKKAAEFDALVREITDILKEEKDSFFQKKYAFQLLRLLFYSTSSKAFNQVYNTYFKPVKNRTVLDWWAMHYKSIKLEQEEKTDSANYLHALVFSHSTNKMYVSKDFFSRKNFDAVLSMAQNDGERADLYLLREVINPGQSLEGINQVYTLAPDHKHLPLLISREINKLEDWLGSTKFANSPIATDWYYFWNNEEKPLLENWQSDFEYLKKITKAVKQMHSLEQRSSIYYNFSMAYLYLMQGDAANAAVYIKAAQPESPEEIYQHTVFKIILATQTKDITKSSVQEDIGIWLKQLVDQRAQKFESQKTLYSISSYLRYTFAKKGMIHLAGLFDNFAVNEFCYYCHPYSFEYSMVSYLDQYATPADVEKLIHLYDRADKNALEEILLKPYSHKYYLLDLLSAKYLRKGDLNNARRALKDIPDDFWFTFGNATYNIDRDPFTENENLFETEETMRSYNKREIVERMYTLEEEAKRDPSKRRENYLQLANAWYNFTDNCWFMVSYGRGSATMVKDVYSVAHARALEYYKKALPYEKTDENRARILYMIIVTSEPKDVRMYALQYEKCNKTDFYARRNCLTLRDLATGNL